MNQSLQIAFIVFIGGGLLNSLFIGYAIRYNTLEQECNTFIDSFFRIIQGPLLRAFIAFGMDKIYLKIYSNTK